MTTEPTPQNREADMPDTVWIREANFVNGSIPVSTKPSSIFKDVKYIRADLANKPALDAEEESCKGCPKDADCDDYRIDGNPCDGKKGWFKCDQCDKLLPTQNGLEKHKRYHVPEDAEVREMANAYEEERAKYLGGIVKYPSNGEAFIGCMKKAISIRAASAVQEIPCVTVDELMKDSAVTYHTRDAIILLNIAKKYPNGIKIIKDK